MNLKQSSMHLCCQVLVKERNLSAAINNWEVSYGEVDAIQDGRNRRVTFRDEPEVREVTTEYQFYRMEDSGSSIKVSRRPYRIQSIVLSRSKMLLFRRKIKEREKSM